MLSLCIKSRLDLQGEREQASKEGEENFINIRVMKLGASKICCVTNQAGA